MNKKSILIVVIIILIIALAIFTGIKLSKDDANSTNAQPEESSTISPEEDDAQTKEPETSTPLETTSPEVETTPKNEDIKTLSSEEKVEYAKQIAKSYWENLGVDKEVYYSVDTIISNNKYQIAVRDSATTQALVWYEVDIQNKTCEVI